MFCIFCDLPVEKKGLFYAHFLIFQIFIYTLDKNVLLISNEQDLSKKDNLQSEMVCN
jgi:hypothetical protein